MQSQWAGRLCGCGIGRLDDAGRDARAESQGLDVATFRKPHVMDPNAPRSLQAEVPQGRRLDLARHRRAGDQDPTLLESPMAEPNPAVIHPQRPSEAECFLLPEKIELVGRQISAGEELLPEAAARAL